MVMSDGELELWAGAECTVNRVGDRWFDQLCRTGHHDRIDDIDRLAALGVTRVRFPVLWERVAPHGPRRADWRWTDERLGRLRALGIDPIVGLVHHGSGPAGTDLTDPGFVEGLAAFAEAVARRYPWVRAFTPINEPLTTARFSGLYGHWYPHARDTAACLRALVLQVRATAAAMQRIRAIVPGARLVQTEDLGRVSSTPRLSYQRGYEAHRRWLSLDLLAGHVDARHPMRGHLEEHGADPDELDALVERPCPPDVIGINYYLTSDRHLDHRLERYPAGSHGGNGRHRYADVEAVRVGGVGIAGHRALLEEVWARYATPVAITEVHLGCTREEQLRWVAEAWQAAVDARRGGVDVRAVTLWSAFGVVDWHCLVTREEGCYEAGVYDVRAPAPRPTALAVLARELSAGRTPSHPLLASAGWWRRSSSPGHEPRPSRALPPGPARPLLVTGTGVLADRLVARCARRGIACARLPRIDRGFTWRLAPEPEPWAVVVVPESPSPRGPSHDEDALAGVLRLARACETRRLPLAVFSSHAVFDGTASRPCVESDPARADTTEGVRQRRLEAWIQSAVSGALIVRAGLLLDPEDPDDPLARVLAALAGGDRVRLPDDEIVAASLVPQLVDAALDLLIDGEQGIWHATHLGSASLRRLCELAAAHAGIATEGLEPGRSREGWGLERGPGMHAIASERAWPMPRLEVALASYVAISQVSARIVARPGCDAATSAA